MVADGAKPSKKISAIRCENPKVKKNTEEERGQGEKKNRPKRSEPLPAGKKGVPYPERLRVQRNQRRKDVPQKIHDG